MTQFPRLARQTAAAHPGIVHLGPGAFFKAFNAVYTDDALRHRGGDWGIVAVSLQSDRAARELRPQGCVYTSIVLSETEDAAPRIVNAISDVLVAPHELETVLALMCDPSIRLVSLTITEKGYCLNPATGALRLDSEEIVSDLANPLAPKTAPGILVEALARRRAGGYRPFAVLSCDNLPNNGHITRQVVLDFARARDASLAKWIQEEVPFPATMVDRITPAMTPEDVSKCEARLGYSDPACVQHEPFRQWVIEDQFVSGERPAWEAGGAQFVKSVAAHEMMKLRCLNGTHSTLAYLGYLAGYDTIAETVADRDFSALCKMLWSQEILPTVPQPEGENLDAYVAALLDRYRNPAIRHRTWQIAMDGSQKLPQRLLGTISDRLNAGTVPLGLCLAIAAWMRYVGGLDENGHSIDVRDPLAEQLHAASDSSDNGADKVLALLSQREVFEETLASDIRFQDAVIAGFELLHSQGAKAAVRQYLSQMT